LFSAFASFDKATCTLYILWFIPSTKYFFLVFIDHNLLSTFHLAYHTVTLSAFFATWYCGHSSKAYSSACGISEGYCERTGTHVAWL